MQIEIGEALAVGGTVGGAMIWIARSVIAPLSEQIKSLIASINRLNDSIEQERAARHELEVRIAEVDARARSNTHRIDKLEDAMHEEHDEVIT